MFNALAESGLVRIRHGRTTTVAGEPERSPHLRVRAVVLATHHEDYFPCPRHDVGR
jgi:DNA-binding FadR family transcriptional regulator